MPCSFPDRSLFRKALKMPFYPAKISLLGTYPIGVARDAVIFPVFFPVKREFIGE
jgi:hypothetical protein